MISQNRFVEAEIEARLVKDSNRYHYDIYYSRNLDVIFALIMTGRISEAMESIESTHKNSENYLGKGIPLSAGLLALRGMANNALNNLESAYRDFMDSIPALAKSRSYDENRFLNHRYQKENPGITKAQAHQMAMLQLIDGHGMLDVDGRIIAIYAHPFFWAPFIIVGDNGMANLN